MKISSLITVKLYYELITVIFFFKHQINICGILLDLSRMYLPPKIESVASSGFGGQVDASNNFGDDTNYGYGEVGLNRDTHGWGSSVDSNTNYDTSTKATSSLNGVQTTLGPAYGMSTSSKSEGSSFDQSTGGHNALTPEAGNDFGQNLNVNNAYVDLSSPGTSNYGGPLGTNNNNGATAQTESADGYGQKELLNTAQSQGVLQNSYNELAAVGGTFSRDTDTGKQYNPVGTDRNKANDYSNKDPTLFQDNNRNGGGRHIYDQRNDENYGSSDRQLQSGNGLHRIPNSSNQKPTNNGVYDSANLADNAGYSYDQPSTGFVGFSSPNRNSRNNPSTLQTNNGINDDGNNYSQYGTLNTQNSQVGEHSQRAVASTLKYEQSSDARSPSQSDSNYFSNAKNFNSKFGESSSQISPSNGQFEQNPTDSYTNGIGSSSFAGPRELNSIGGGKELRSGTTSALNDLYGQSRSSSSYENGFSANSHGSSQRLNALNDVQSGKNYGQNVPASNELYNNRGSLQSRLNQGHQNPQSGDYDQLRHAQSHATGGNCVHSLSANSPVNGKCNRGGPSNVFAGQSRFPQIPNSYGPQTEYRPSSSGTGNYGQSGSSTSAAGGGGYTQGSSYGVTGGSRSYGITDRGVGGQNPSNRGNSFQLGTNQGAASTAYSAPPETNGYAQTQNSLPTTKYGGRAGQGGSFSNHGHRGSCASLCSKIVGRNGLADSAAGVGSSDRRSQKKYSTLVPRNQYQNSNLPAREKGGSYDDEHRPGDYGEENAFSNYSPQDPRSRFGNDDRPLSTNNNYNNNNDSYDRPGSNSFSNLAPDNQSNRPRPANPAAAAVNSNDCGKSGSATNKQTEAIFSNTAGY